MIYVQNVTDVDDPLLERAARDGEDWRELARREIQRYRSDMEALRILPPTHLVGAVEALPVIERFTARMADRGALYDVDQDLYFAKSADPEFGALSGPGTPSGYDPAEMADLSARARRRPRPAGEEGPAGHPGLARRTPRRARLGLAVRPRPARLARRVRRDRHRVPGRRLRRAGGRFGPGVPAPRAERVARPGRVRPGRGGVFARVYAHAGMVSYQGHKMSKSLGNLVFVNRLLADGVDPMAIRMALLAHHYRSDWEWTDAALADADARLARWRAALAHTEAAASAGPDDAPSAAAAETLAGVRARMRDDLDAPGALGIVDRWADRLLADAPTRITPADVAGARLVRDTVDALLGISL